MSGRSVVKARPVLQTVSSQQAMRMIKGVPILALAATLLGSIPAWAGSTPIELPEKRIALVIGEAAYPRSPLTTAANDAGLVAQTLQAAGFDVEGARDLDGPMLRQSFRDFIDKVAAAGPGSVAMLYLSGYGLQVGGENYFLPVDAQVARGSDVAVDGVNISEWLRQLAALPVKAGVVVLDAARRQPFSTAGEPIASGLALVEPAPHLLVAFNAAPGTTAPGELAGYGIYAQALAEMIRSGGLTLPQIFDRVRLRTNAASHGTLVPWDADRTDQPFLFLERRAIPPSRAMAADGAVANRPFRDFGVQDAYANAIQHDSIPAYEEFLAAYPGDPLAKQLRILVAARREAIIWQRSCHADRPETYWTYLRRYPYGPHAADASQRLSALAAPPEPPSNFTPVQFDVLPPPPEEIIDFDRPAVPLNDKLLAVAAPPPPPGFFLPPRPAELAALPPPLAPTGPFDLPRPLFVPIAANVEPPAYVVPPPNDIIFANIHNTAVINALPNQPAPVPATSQDSRAAAAAAGPALPPVVTPRAASNEAPVVQTVGAAINPPAHSGAAAPPGPGAAPISPSALALFPPPPPAGPAPWVTNARLVPITPRAVTPAANPSRAATSPKSQGAYASVPVAGFDRHSAPRPNPPPHPARADADERPAPPLELTPRPKAPLPLTPTAMPPPVLP